MAPATTSSMQRLDGLDRLLLILPMLAGLVLGLFPLFAAPVFAQVTNYPPNDILIYWLAGADTLGYGVALAIGLLQSDWTGLRFPVIAGLCANVLVTIASIVEVALDAIAETVRVRGRGGTVLQPAIDLLQRAEDFPKNGPLLIITDGQCDRLVIQREHAFLMPEGASLPFIPRGPVFRLR